MRYLRPPILFPHQSSIASISSKLDHEHAHERWLARTIVGIDLFVYGRVVIVAVKSLLKNGKWEEKVMSLSLLFWRNDNFCKSRWYKLYTNGVEIRCPRDFQTKNGNQKRPIQLFLVLYHGSCQRHHQTRNGHGLPLQQKDFQRVSGAVSSIKTKLRAWQDNPEGKRLFES